MTRTARVLRALGPAVARPSLREILRAAIGVGIGLMITAALAAGLRGNAPLSGLLVAPLGASAFLIFAVPNSPLAQPWSVVMGNFASAVVAILVVDLVPYVWLALPLAVAGSALAMMVLRAMHPPGGAVALSVVLAAQSGTPDFSWAIVPVALDSALLVLSGVLYTRPTGRRYPFRQSPDASIHGTRDMAPERRLGLTPDDLGALLARMNLAANIGTEDLARVLAAAEAEAAAQHIGATTAADLMSRDVVTLQPEDSAERISALFHIHRFKTLPVVDALNNYLGLVNEHDLLESLREGVADTARTIATQAQSVNLDTPLAVLLPLLSDGHQQAVPVVENRKLVGLVTRSDLIATLAHVVATAWPSA
jgi:CBS domain-containing membrane protein